MNIVKHEVIELSANENKAFDIVDRILEKVACNAENPDLRDSAREALLYLRSFKCGTEEIK